MSKTYANKQGQKPKISKLVIACAASSVLAIPFAIIFLRIEESITSENPYTHLTGTICEISLCLSFLLPVVYIVLGIVAFIQRIFSPCTRGWRLALAGIIISILSLVIYFPLLGKYVFTGIA